MNTGDLISGKYRLQRLLGSGGMGSVWAARNELTERDFAIKFLLPELAGSPDALHRFFVEARACGRIKHPAVVEVYDVGQADDGSPYLVMELLDGEGLDRRLQRSGPLPPADAAAYLSFVARGLHEAHLRGVIHRDLKPGNVFLSVDPMGEVVPKILDFGVSKATNLQSDQFTTTAGVVLGSPAYMSPEQARGETEIDGRSDVWSLGVILYQTLAGHVPFEAPNYNALMVKIQGSPYRSLREISPDVPKELAALVDRALVKDRSKRIGTARDFAEQLEALLAGLYFDRRRSPLVKTPAAGLSATKLVPDAGGSSWTNRALGTASVRVAGTRLLVLTVVVLVLVGVGAFAQLRSPPVAVAASASRVFAVTLARMSAQITELVAESALERAKEAQRRKPTAAPAATWPSPHSSSKRTLKHPSAHGGMQDPGF